VYIFVSATFSAVVAFVLTTHGSHSHIAVSARVSWVKVL